MQRKTDRRTLKEAVTLYGVSLAIVIVAFIVAYQFVKPAPPKTITMATGSVHNMYHHFAMQYQQALKQQGIELKLIPTKGSVDNLQLLNSGKVDIALVQSGINPEPETELKSLGSLYYEPLWLFTKADLSINKLSELKQKRIAIGLPGSGTTPVAMTVLADNDIDEANTELLNLSTEEAVNAILEGDIDAVFLVTGLKNAYVQQLLKAKTVEVFNFSRAEAYNRLHPFLSAVTLPEGVIDLQLNIPAEPINLLAPTATLVVQNEFHPALAALFLQIASGIHQTGGILEPRGLFPSPEYIDFPLNEDAERFYQSGPPFLQRYMPFWAANLVDRLVVLIVPLLTLILPLMKILPPTYRWRIRSRIYRWYDQLRDIEYRAEAVKEPEQSKELLQDLLEIEKELMMTDIPKSYAESQYNLRLHIRLIRERLEWKLK